MVKLHLAFIPLKVQTLQLCVEFTYRSFIQNVPAPSPTCTQFYHVTFRNEAVASIPMANSTERECHCSRTLCCRVWNQGFAFWGPKSIRQLMQSP